MLNFFRKYQKFFFIVVTVFIVISFSFFGTFSTLAKGDGTHDREIAKAIDGSSITLKELEAVSRLLATSYEERTTAPNLFNDGVIRKELFSTSMASLLVKRHFDEISKDLEPRLKKAKHYKSYVHPKAPFISAELTWQQYFPAMNRDLAVIKGYSGNPSLEEFNLLVRIYLSQLQLPPDVLKQLLLYQQGHFQNLAPDPRLQQLDLSLFGFHTMEDWFGPQFLQHVSKFILNCAVAATQKGYTVSYDEARADLFRNVQTALKYYQLNVQEAPAYFQQQLSTLQLDEITAVKAWRKVMLFRRLFHDVGNAAVIDPLMYESFENFAKEGIAVELYQLPEALRFKDLNSVFQLKMYLDAVAIHSDTGVLPTEFLSPEEVEKRLPEIVQQRFTIEFAEMDKEQLVGQVSLKETWDWELEDRNWEVLQQMYPILKKCTASDPEARFQYLDTLNSKERGEIDYTARQKIVDAHPEWIEEGLKNAPIRLEEISIRSKGGRLPLGGIQDSRHFVDLLIAAQREESAAKEQLRKFTQDQRFFYQVNVLSASNEKEILPFAVVVQDGTLQNVLDDLLEAAYPEVRRKEPSVFLNADRTPKPFHSVREEIGRRVFSSLVTEIEGRPELRLVHYVRLAKEHLEQNPEDPAWVKLAAQEESEPLKAQWLLQKTSRIITRSSEDQFSKEAVLALPINAWSEVEVSTAGDLSFFKVIEKVAPSSNTAALEGQGILSIGARRFLMAKILDEMVQHGS